MITPIKSIQPLNATSRVLCIEPKEGGREDSSLQSEKAFQKVLEKARKRLAQKEYYTPEEAYQITMQSIREVYAI